MARILYRLGGWSFDHRRLVVALWLVVVVGIGALASAVSKPTVNALSLPGTEAQQAQDLLAERFPGAGGATSRIVFAAPAGRTLDEKQYAELVQPTASLAKRVPQSLGSSRAFAATLTFSEDRRVAFADLQFLVPVSELKDSTKEALEKVAEPARAKGLQVEFSGGATASTEGEHSSAELIGVGVALLVLLVTFGALLSALLPIVVALVSVAVGLMGVSVATGLVDLNATTPVLASMLGLAVGIDYALFIVSRHRQQVADGMDTRESVALATGTAGSAVVFAGVTVIIALAGMLVIGIPFLTAMGLAGAGTVLVAVIVALTLLPALLGFLGSRARKGRHIDANRAMGARWASLVTRRPIAAVVIVVAGLGLMAVPVAGMRLALPDDSTKPAESTEYKSYQLLRGAFGPGFSAPLLVVGDAKGVRNAKQTIASAAKSLEGFPGVATVSAPAFNQAGDLAIVAVTPRSEADSVQTKELVGLVRESAAAAERQSGLRGYVTGSTATAIDISDKISQALPGFLILIGALALVLLLIVFRSIAVPIKAVAGFLLTIAATFGLSTWILQEGHGLSLLGMETASPLVSFLPVLGIAILFGLAMDYEVFLVSRMRERFTHGDTPTAAVVHGFASSGRVVTAAALIMIAVFVAFLQTEDLVTKSIALALAFGILIDAFLVRMTLVPAVLALLGKRAWALPAWLDRRLPNVDIEGEALTHRQPVDTPARPAIDTPQS